MDLIQDTTSRTGLNLLASDMIKAGFINSIIQIETGVGLKKINTQRRALCEQGLAKTFDKRMHMRVSSSVVRAPEDYITASNLMLLYVQMCGDAAKHTVHLKELVEAHRISLFMFLEASPECVEEDFMDINSAYSLAKEFRDKGAYFQQCPCCQHASFVIMNNAAQDRCAFCKSVKLLRGNILISSLD